MKRVMMLAVLLIGCGCDVKPGESSSASTPVTSAGPAVVAAEREMKESDAKQAESSLAEARSQAVEAARGEAWHQELADQLDGLAKKRDAAKLGGSPDEKIRASAEWNKARLEMERREADAVAQSQAVATAQQRVADARIEVREAQSREARLAEEQRQNTRREADLAKLVGDLRSQNVFTKVEHGGTSVRAYAGAAFYFLDVDQKNTACSVVLAWGHASDSDCHRVRLYDGKNGKSIGSFAATGLSLD